MSWSGWVSLENQLRRHLPEAKLKLVAGDVHRVQRRRRPMAMRGGRWRWR